MSKEKLTSAHLCAILLFRLLIKSYLTRVSKGSVSLCVYIIKLWNNCHVHLNLTEILKSQSYWISITSLKKASGEILWMSSLGERNRHYGMPLTRYWRTIRETYFGYQASLVSLLRKVLIKYILRFLAVAGFKRTQCFTPLLWPMSS